MIALTKTLVVARPAATEVAVMRIPAEGVGRVHSPAGGHRDFEPELADVAWWLVVPGDRDAIGWGWAYGWYAAIHGVRNGKHRLDRDAWHQAAREVRHGGVAYVQYEPQEYYRKQRWTAVGVRRDEPTGGTR